MALLLACVAIGVQGKHYLRPYALKHPAKSAAVSADTAVTDDKAAPEKSPDVLAAEAAAAAAAEADASAAINPSQPEQVALDAGPVMMPAPQPKPAPVIAPVTAPVVNAEQPAAVKQLWSDLAEVKQMRKNVVAVEKTLAADVALLRETATLQKMSKTAQARSAASTQLHEATRLVKETEAMVRKSREDAEDRARAALHEATEVRNAASALITEANREVKAAGQDASTAKTAVAERI
jgi:hypothetical protein